jgi:hypothetical protein
MSEDHAPAGLLIAALGAAVLAISVFLPWYGVSITASGASVARQELAAVAQQYGNASLQAQAGTLGAEFSLLAGHELGTVSAHQALGHVSLILLLLAGVGLLAALLRLADMKGWLFATGNQVALVGGLAFFVVLFRILVTPDSEMHAIALTLSWGIWLALLSASAIVAGGLIAGAGLAQKRSSTKVGPGPPQLVPPPSVRAISQTPLSPRDRRRR